MQKVNFYVDWISWFFFFKIYWFFIISDFLNIFEKKTHAENILPYFLLFLFLLSIFIWLGI